MNKIHMLLAVIFVALLGGNVQAQARTWGFSRDAVFEGGAPGDSVTLLNQAADTLKFDTVWVEMIALVTQGFRISFLRGPSGGQQYTITTPPSSSGPNPKTLVVSPFQSALLLNINIDLNAPPLAKSAASTAVGDTLRARLIFQASAGRGLDTLLVNGIQQTTSLRFMPGARNGGQTALDRSFDPLGRRVDPVPDGVRVLLRPVIAPRE